MAIATREAMGTKEAMETKGAKEDLEASWTNEFHNKKWCQLDWRTNSKPLVTKDNVKVNKTKEVKEE